jgi:hypothetical protein
MRTSYPGYTPRTEHDLDKLWAECVFAFDASALLDLYRLTPETRDTVLNILDRLKERLWLPHQAGLEYHDNRLQVIATGLGSYSRIPELARDIAKSYRKSLDTYRQYRWVEAERWIGLLDETVKKIEDTISKQERVLGGFLETDPVEEKLNKIFDGKVGPPYTDMHDIYVRAEQRLQLSIPPGFKDAATKKDFHRYGDVVLWLQLLDYAKMQKKSIIFVTSDAKTDWWLERDGKTIGPRPELLQEMHATASVMFHMYPPDRFVEYAERHLKSKLKPAVIKKTTQELRAVESEKSAETERQSDELLRTIAAFKMPEMRLSDELMKTIAAFNTPEMRQSDELMKTVAAFNTPAMRLSDEFMKTVAAFNTPAMRLSDELMKTVAAFNTPAMRLSDEFMKTVAAFNTPAMRLNDELMKTVAAFKIPHVGLSEELLRSIASAKQHDLDEKSLPNTSTALTERAGDSKQEDIPKSDTPKSFEKHKPK